MRADREIITSSQNQYVSLTRGLASKKNRESEGAFRFDGVKLMCEALRKGVKIRFILISEPEYDAVMEKAERLYGIKKNELPERILTVSEQVFGRLSEENAPEGVICVAEYMDTLRRGISAEELASADPEEKILLLESVRDPQNVGAIVRVAAAFGVDRIVMSRDCADVYNSKTLRASMGTAFGTRIDLVDDLPATVGALRTSGRRVFAAALSREASKLGELVLRTGDCVVIGNEGHGLTEETVRACTGAVFIPMAEQVESLNAATAAAVLVWEFFGSNGRKGGTT